jgi:hypothetical protein
MFCEIMFSRYSKVLDDTIILMQHDGNIYDQIKFFCSRSQVLISKYFISIRHSSGKNRWINRFYI